MPKFYITGLYHTSEFNDKTLPPLEIEVEVNDRLEAITSIGATVWTEEEFTRMRQQSKQDGITWPEPVKVR